MCSYVSPRCIQKTLLISPPCSCLPLIPLRCSIERFMCILKPTTVRNVQLLCSNSWARGLMEPLHPLLTFRSWTLAGFSCVSKANPDDILLHCCSFVWTHIFSACEPVHTTHLCVRFLIFCHKVLCLADVMNVLCLWGWAETLLHPFDGSKCKSFPDLPLIYTLLHAPLSIHIITAILPFHT